MLLIYIKNKIQTALINIFFLIIYKLDVSYVPTYIINSMNS